MVVLLASTLEENAAQGVGTADSPGPSLDADTDADTDAVADGGDPSWCRYPFCSRACSDQACPAMHCATRWNESRSMCTRPTTAFAGRINNADHPLLLADDARARGQLPPAADMRC